MLGTMSRCLQLGLLCRGVHLPKVFHRGQTLGYPVKGVEQCYHLGALQEVRVDFRAM